MLNSIKNKVIGQLEQANLWRTNNRGNRGQINQNVGIVINGISEETLSGWFAELRGQIQRDNDYMVEAVTNAIDSVLVSKVAKIVAEAYHTHCLSYAPEKNALQLTLSDIQNKAGSITTEIQAVIQECNGTKEKVDEVVKRLNSLNEGIKAELRNILNLCENILSEIRFANERIGKLTTLAKENKAAIADLKDIVLSYIQLAEQHHEESQRILASQNERLSSPGWDEQTIVAMRVWFDKISRDISEKSINTEEIIGSIENQKKILKGELEEVSKRLDGIESLVEKYGRASGKQLEELKEQLSQKAQETLQHQAELYSLALDINQVVHRIGDNVDELKWMVIQVREIIMKSNMPEAEKAKWQEQLQRAVTEKDEMEARFRMQIFDLQEALKIEQSSGAERNESECPWCGYFDSRKIIGDECVCGICGHRFLVKDVDPNMRSLWLTPEQEQEMISRWKENHTVELERVSGDQNKFLYRMKWPLHACEDGILIIPSKDNAGEKITTIDFCQPNTDDEEGRERLSKVKKLFLSAGIEIGRFNDVPPFSEISELDKVMTQTDIGFTENEEQRKKIKGEVANDA